MAMFQNFKRVDGQYPGSKLPDPEGALAQEVPSHAISAENTEVALLQQAGGAKDLGDCLPLLHKEVPRGSMHPKRVGRHDIHGPSLERRK